MSLLRAFAEIGLGVAQIITAPIVAPAKVVLGSASDFALKGAGKVLNKINESEMERMMRENPKELKEMFDSFDRIMGIERNTKKES